MRLKFTLLACASAIREMQRLQLKLALLLLLSLGATVRDGKAKQAVYDEDDDFAEFDFDLEEEGTESELILFSAYSKYRSLVVYVCYPRAHVYRYRKGR